MSQSSNMNVIDALYSRTSVRGFLDRPVEKELLTAILLAAARAPSGVNHQPWHVDVVSGEVRDRLVRRVQVLRVQEPERETHPKRFGEYDYYPHPMPDPYLTRRRTVGWSMYQMLGVQKGDRAASAQVAGRNFDFFGAPVGLIFTIDRVMEQGSWLDYGGFLQSLMLAARAYGLDTCAQGAWCHFYDVIRDELGIPDSRMVVCGMSLGYADADWPTYQLRTDRMALGEFVRFHGELEDSPVQEGA